MAKLAEMLRKLEEDTGFLISAHVAGFDADSWGRVIAIVERAELQKERALAGRRDGGTRARWQDAKHAYENPDD
jgi:hypothetical protein